MEFIIDNLAEISVILSGIAIVAVAITQITPTPKDNKQVEKIINAVERIIRKDLDKDGDIGEPNA